LRNRRYFEHVINIFMRLVSDKRKRPNSTENTMEFVTLCHKLVSQAMGWGTKQFVKNFQLRSGLLALLKIGAWLRFEKTNLTEWKTWSGLHMRTESEAYGWADMQTGRQPMGLAECQETLETWQRYLSALAAARSNHGHKQIMANVFCHCDKLLLGCFDYIVKLCKISTHGFWFLLV